MLKKFVIITVFVLLFVILTSCTRGVKDDTSSDMSGISSRPSVTSRPDTTSRSDTTSRTASEESNYDNASVGDNSKGIIDDIVSGAGDIVSGVANGIGDAFDGKWRFAGKRLLT